MPNNMDLKDITKRRTDGLNYTGSNLTKEGKRVYITYNYHNMFLKEPTEYCKERIPRSDENIQLEIREPQDGKTVTSNFNLLFSASSPTRDIRNVVVFVDGVLKKNFKYQGKKNITDMQSIDISDLPLGKHKIKIEAIDVKGYSNGKIFEIKTIDKDTQAPVLLKDKINIKKNDKGVYEISLLFNDDLSSIV
ncbi:MAG: hypothetical protein GXP45_07940 [bacterium]|nr:hypothetical protein [bacterium]